MINAAFGMKPSVCHRAWWLGLSAILASCAGVQASVPKRGIGDRSTKPVTISLLIDASTPGQVGTHFVRPQDQLHSGDTVTFKVEVDRPAYVYVVWYSIKGWSSVLFPESGDQLVNPGAPLVVTNHGKRIPLDEQVGEENIYAIASTRPILEADATLRDVLRIPGPGGQRDNEPPPPPPDPPPGPKPEERGGDQASQENEYKVRVKANDKGVAMLRFTFKHSP